MNVANQQCLTVHAGGMRNVGTLPCDPVLLGLQTWNWAPTAGDPTTGSFVSSAHAPGVAKSCLARSPDVRGGASEVFAGPLAGGDLVVVLWNRNEPAAANITARWEDLGLPPAQPMKVRDLWAHADMDAPVAGSITMLAEVHGVVMLRLSPTV